MRALFLVVACVLGLLAGSGVARAEASGNRATFALIVGSNASVDKNLAPLRYADDDAARYLDLFRLLGARTYLLTRLDENTLRLHPQAAAEAEAPTRAGFDKATAQLGADVARAAARGLETVVYLVYAGHGNVKDGQGYITLEDDRITGAELGHIAARIPAATRIHVIVDACASYFLAYSRGPGGERRALAGFRTSALADDARVGVLLSTSSARESHEWDAFQSGVFSHEVRSGLYGAADADGNGEVSYREIAAFVTRANAAIPNERFRPDLFARAPRDSGTLADIRTGLQRKLVIDSAHAGHYVLEDARGVRLAEVHSGPRDPVSLVRPGPSTTVYLRRVDDDREYLLQPTAEQLALADLEPTDPRARTRGALHESFSLLFTLPFDDDAVASYRAPDPSLPAAPEPGDPRPAAAWRKPLGYGALGLGVVGLGVGTGFAIASQQVSAGGSDADSQRAAETRNGRISRFNAGSVVSFAAGGAMAATGLVLLLWPSAPKNVSVSWLPGGGQLGYFTRF